MRFWEFLGPSIGRQFCWIPEHVIRILQKQQQNIWCTLNMSLVDIWYFTSQNCERLWYYGCITDENGVKLEYCKPSKRNSEFVVMVSCRLGETITWCNLYHANGMVSCCPTDVELYLIIFSSFCKNQRTSTYTSTKPITQTNQHRHQARQKIHNRTFSLNKLLTLSFHRCKICSFWFKGVSSLLTIKRHLNYHKTKKVYLYTQYISQRYEVTSPRIQNPVANLNVRVNSTKNLKLNVWLSRTFGFIRLSRGPSAGKLNPLSEQSTCGCDVAGYISERFAC